MHVVSHFMFLILAGRLIRNHFFLCLFFLLLSQRTCPGRGHMAYVQYVNVTAFHIHKLKSTSLQLDRFLCPALVAFPRLPSPLALPSLVPYFPSFPTFCFTIRFAALLVPFFQHAHIHRRMYNTHSLSHTHSHTHSNTRSHTPFGAVVVLAVCCLLFDMHRLHK